MRKTDKRVPVDITKVRKALKQGIHFRSIRFTLIAAFLIPIGFIIFLGFSLYQKASEGMIDNYESTSLVSLDMMGEYYELGLTNVYSKATQIITDETITNYYSRYYSKKPSEEAKIFSEIGRKVNLIYSGDNFISNIYIFAEYGYPISTVSTNEKLEQGIYEKFNESEDGADIINSTETSFWKGGHPFLDSQFPDFEKKYCLTLIRKLNNTGYKKIGYVIIDIDKTFVMDTLKKANFGDQSMTGLVTSDGNAVISGDVAEGFDITKESFYQKAIESKDEQGAEYVSHQGREYLFVFSKLSIGNTTVFSLIPKTEVVKQADSMKLITIIIVIITSLIAMAVGILISNGISSTIHKTNQKLSLVAAGDLTVDAAIHRKDEFHVLGKSINHMLSSMRALIEKMQGVSKTTAVSANEVAAASQMLLSSSKNIANAVGDIDSGVSQQAADAENCLRRMADLAGQINTVQESTGKIELIADNTKNIVRGGLNVIHDLSVKAKDTSDITHHVIHNIESLEEESSAIMGIINAMDEITEQTNLLSLNATIEAARVGAAGRGFAVVADEIRKLADKSSQESGRIAAVIAKIQDRTKKTVNAAKQAESIVANQELALKDTMNTFDNINQHVENLTSNLEQISSGIEKIAKAKEDTLYAIESISATLEETVAASNEVSSTAENQLSSVEQLSNAAMQLGEDARNLEETIQLFHIN